MVTGADAFTITFDAKVDAQGNNLAICVPTARLYSDVLARNQALLHSGIQSCPQSCAPVIAISSSYVWTRTSGKRHVLACQGKYTEVSQS